MIPRRRPRFYKGEVKDIWNLISNNRVETGKYIKIFERKFADYIGTEFAIATCAGRVAMELILDSLNLEKGDEIIVPAYTLKDLIYLLREKGWVPKLVDVEEDSFNIDPDLIEKEITKRTKVIMATHIFGQSCNMEKIRKVAKKYNLKVIEDCAHAAGGSFKGNKVGSFGNAGFFSLETTKPINTFGGGVITTDDPQINLKVRKKIKQYPFDSNKVINKILFSYIEHLIIISSIYRFLNMPFMFKSTSKIIGKLYLFLHGQAKVGYSKFTNLQALLGLKQLSSLDKRNKRRRNLASYYNQNLPPGLKPQDSKYSENEVFYFYVAKVKNNIPIEEIRRKLLLRGIDAGIKNEITDDCTLSWGNPKEFSVVHNVYEKAIQLPMCDELTKEKVKKITKFMNHLKI